MILPNFCLIVLCIMPGRSAMSSAPTVETFKEATKGIYNRLPKSLRLRQPEKPDAEPAGVSVFNLEREVALTHLLAEASAIVSTNMEAFVSKAGTAARVVLHPIAGTVAKGVGGLAAIYDIKREYTNHIEAGFPEELSINQATARGAFHLFQTFLVPIAIFRSSRRLAKSLGNAGPHMSFFAKSPYAPLAVATGTTVAYTLSTDQTVSDATHLFFLDRYMKQATGLPNNLTADSTLKDQQPAYIPISGSFVKELPQFMVLEAAPASDFPLRAGNIGAPFNSEITGQVNFAKKQPKNDRHASKTASAPLGNYSYSSSYQRFMDAAHTAPIFTSSENPREPKTDLFSHVPKVGYTPASAPEATALVNDALTTAEVVVNKFGDASYGPRWVPGMKPSVEEYVEAAAKSGKQLSAADIETYKARLIADAAYREMAQDEAFSVHIRPDAEDVLSLVSSQMRDLKSLTEEARKQKLERLFPGVRDPKEPKPKTPESKAPESKASEPK